MPRSSLLIAFSLAALSFLPIWPSTINSSYYYEYPVRIYDPLFYLTILFWLFSWTGILALMIRFSSNFFVYSISCFAAAGIALIIVNTVRLELELGKVLSGNSLIALGIICISLLIYFFVQFRHKFLRFLQVCVLIISPFAFLVAGKTIWIGIAKIESPLTDSTTLSPIESIVKNEQKESPRILWMIFDELDIRFAFEHRGDLTLPNLDKLKNSSLYATNAYAAESDTLHSIPAMFSGLNLINPVILDNQDLKFTIAGTQKSVSWREIPSIFDKAKKLNLKTAILGNYHPYYKIFGSKVDYCLPACTPELSLGKKISRYSRLIFNTIIFDGIPLLRRSGLFSENIVREIFIDAYQHMLDKALKVISDPDYNLIFTHWTIPHAPGIYDRTSKKFDPFYQANYLDNLVLVDETIGKVWEESKNLEIWDSTIVIVTSDHWLRKIMLDRDICQTLTTEMKDLISKPDYRVPLLIKMPHQHGPVLYTGDFRMYHIHDMLENMLNGTIKTSNDLTSWMDVKKPKFSMEGL